MRTADSFAAVALAAGVFTVAADGDAAGGADGETGVDSATLGVGLTASGTPVVAAGDIVADAAGGPTVAIEPGSRVGAASVVLVTGVVRVEVIAAGRTGPATSGFDRLGAAAARTADDRDDVVGRRVAATLVELVVDGDDGLVAVPLGCAFTGDGGGATAGRSSRAGITFGRSIVAIWRSTVALCCAGVTVARTAGVAAL